MNRLWYFAHPYTGDEETNYEDSQRKMQVLLDMGYNVISPIGATHDLHKDKPRTYDFWMKLVSVYLTHCDGIIFDPEWRFSPGCHDEHIQAMYEGKEILFYEEIVNDD